MSRSTEPRAAGTLVTRRQGLLAAALLGPLAALAACGSESEPAAALSEQASPEPALETSVAAEESVLIAHYDAVIAGLGEGREALVLALRELQGQHVAHRTSLGGGADSDPSALPDSPTLASLIKAERAATKARINACVDTTDPELARLLTFIAASEASHVPALKALA